MTVYVSSYKYMHPYTRILSKTIALLLTILKCSMHSCHRIECIREKRRKKTNADRFFFTHCFKLTLKWHLKIRKIYAHRNANERMKRKKEKKNKNVVKFE